MKQRARRMRGIVAIVGTLALLGVTGLTAPGSAAPHDDAHDGKYQGSFSGLDKPGITIIANSVELNVSGFNIEGRLKLQVETADGASILDLSGGESSIAIPLCIILELPLSTGQVSGLLLDADTVTFSGSVQVDIGAGDPKRVDCNAVVPTQAQPMEFEAKVGPSGMEGTLTVGGDVVPFAAKRVGGSGSGDGSSGSGDGSSDGGSGSSGSGGSTPGDSGGEGGDGKGAKIPDYLRDVLAKDVADDVSRILGQDGASIGSLDGVERLVRLQLLGGTDPATLDAIGASLVLAESTVAGKDGPVPAFPNVLALQPVFANLLVKAALADEEADRATIRASAQKLLELALYLDVSGVTPKPR